jgi:hypothetical protein
MNLHAQRFVVLGVAGAAIVALLIAAVARPSHSEHRVNLKALSFEPSGLYDQAGAELPFVTLRISVPELDGEGIEFSPEPFQVECKVRDRWMKIENRASIRWIQNEISFLIWPGTEKCRLHFQYQREGLRWRLLRASVPQGVPYHQFPNRFWQWVWLKTPVGPKLITLMYHRNHFRRPPHWSDMTAEITIHSRLALHEEVEPAR